MKTIMLAIMVTLTLSNFLALMFGYDELDCDCLEDLKEIDV